MSPVFVCLFFFFQAEDGIRDWSVTGVQTCALPIYACRGGGRGGAAGLSHRAGGGWGGVHQLPRGRFARRNLLHHHQGGRRAARWSRRSEERRVGKECRYRWSPDQYKKRVTTEEIGE